MRADCVLGSACRREFLIRAALVLKGVVGFVGVPGEM